VAREIFAYAAPAKTGIVIIDDMADAATAAAANARYGAGFERGEYFLLCLVEPERVIPAQWQDACRAAGKLPNFFEIPWVKERKSLDKVVDLRLPRVQQWFFEEFTDPERLNLGWALPEMSSFHEMLALLQGQHRGGNPLTQAIGRELRLMGVNGLVFPSARCDAAAIVRQGSIVDWYGWNLVDYSQRESGWDAGTMTTMNDLEVLKNGWEFFGFPVGSVKVRLSTRDTFDRGTWQVVGLEAANVLEWTRKLSSDQRRSLGLAADQDLVAGSEDGLHQVEKDFRRRFRELTSQHPEVGLSEQRVRDLLTRVALAIADLPFARLSGDLLTSKDKLGEMAKAGADLDAFLSAATGIGFLVEEAKGYYRMSSKVILDYFASRGPR
jgi:hypothetical protein